MQKTDDAIKQFQELKLNDLHVAFGSTDFLPKLEDIPAEFHKNEWTAVVTKRFHNGDRVEGLVREGVDSHKVHTFVDSHLISWASKHERKIAGVAWRLSQLLTAVRAVSQEGKVTASAGEWPEHIKK